MNTTKIEWTDKSWNPVTGCTKISAGCINCYAEVMARRLEAMGQDKYKNGFNVSLHEEVLNEPLKLKKSHTIFICSMSDLFHNEVPFDFVDKVMNIVKQTPQHRYQLLTKRADRMVKYFKTRKIPSNIWLGVSVENQKTKIRIDYLRELNCAVRFLSCEPLLEDLEKINLENIDWVIVGGESGLKARKMKREWVLNIKEQCDAQGATFFFKQWGTWGEDGIRRNKKENGSSLLNKEWKNEPAVIATQ